MWNQAMALLDGANMMALGLVGVCLLLAALFLVMPYLAIMLALGMQMLRKLWRGAFGVGRDLVLGGDSSRGATREGIRRLAARVERVEATEQPAEG